MNYIFMIEDRWMLDATVNGKWACGRAVSYAHPHDMPKAEFKSLRSDKTEWKLVMTIEVDHSKPETTPVTRVVDDSVEVPQKIVETMNAKIKIVHKHPQGPSASLHRILLFISKEFRTGALGAETPVQTGRDGP